MYRHGPYSGPDKGPERSGIGLASIKRDRFVALEASFDGGEIVTRPVTLKGTTVHLNGKSDFGEIIIELLKDDGTVLARSAPIVRDGVDIPVTWMGDASPVQGTITIRIKLKNARVFALWCGE
jgi:hypothetical protein